MRLGICVVTVAFVLFTALLFHGSKVVMPILRVARVTRHGAETHETRMSVMRDHRYYVDIVDQKQRSPHPDRKLSLGLLSDNSFQRITLLKDSADLQPHNNSPGPIGHQDGDSWYISIPRKRKTQFLAFSIKGANMPDAIKHVIAWFEQTEKLKPIENVSLRDHQCSVFSDDTADAWRGKVPQF
jgi:hypothetical protein